MIKFMPANHSNTNPVLIILIHFTKTRFQSIFVMLLHHVCKDVTSLLLSRHKCYDFNFTNFQRNGQ